MSHRQTSPASRRFRFATWLTILTMLALLPSTARAQSFTNLFQLTQALAVNQQVIGAVDLEVTVCAASRPQLGALIVQDASGAELLQLGDVRHHFQPSERIRIQHKACLLRRREMGIQISARPIVMNDGLHPWVSQTGATNLRAGMIPIRVEWFNYWRYLGLDVLMAISNEPPGAISASNLWHAVVSESGTTNFVPGL